jgi:hypothetical protein
MSRSSRAPQIASHCLGWLCLILLLSTRAWAQSGTSNPPPDTPAKPATSAETPAAAGDSPDALNQAYIAASKNETQAARALINATAEGKDAAAAQTAFENAVQAMDAAYEKYQKKALEVHTASDSSNALRGTSPPANHPKTPEELAKAAGLPSPAGTVPGDPNDEVTLNVYGADVHNVYGGDTWTIGPDGTVYVAHTGGDSHTWVVSQNPDGSVSVSFRFGDHLENIGKGASYTVRFEGPRQIQEHRGAETVVIERSADGGRLELVISQPFDGKRSFTLTHDVPGRWSTLAGGYIPVSDSTLSLQAHIDLILSAPLDFRSFDIPPDKSAPQAQPGLFDSAKDFLERNPAAQGSHEKPKTRTSEPTTSQAKPTQQSGAIVDLNQPVKKLFAVTPEIGTPFWYVRTGTPDDSHTEFTFTVPVIDLSKLNLVAETNVPPKSSSATEPAARLRFPDELAIRDLATGLATVDVSRLIDEWNRATFAQGSQVRLVPNCDSPPATGTTICITKETAPTGILSNPSHSITAIYDQSLFPNYYPAPDGKIATSPPANSPGAPGGSYPSGRGVGSLSAVFTPTATVDFADLAGNAASDAQYASKPVAPRVQVTVVGDTNVITVSQDPRSAIPELRAPDGIAHLRNAAFHIGSANRVSASKAHAPSQPDLPETQRANLTFSLVASGNLGSNALEFRAFDPRGKIKQITIPAGVVLEPLQPKSAKPLDPAKGNAPPHQLSAYCLEIEKLPPEPGQMYRLAPPAVQNQFSGLKGVLDSGRKLADSGQLHPDSEPQAYVDFIRQHAVWAKLENWDEKKFTEVFVERTRKNLAQMNVKWTGDIEKALRNAAPGRWRDISAVLAEAQKVAPVPANAPAAARPN